MYRNQFLDQNQMLNSMFSLGGMPDYVTKYLDTMASIYDYLPVNRRPRSQLSPLAPEVPITEEEAAEIRAEGGGQGDGSDWGKGIGLPTNTELGLPTTIGPAQAAMNVLGLISNPIGLPASLAMQHMGINPQAFLGNLLSPDHQAIPAQVSTVDLGPAGFGLGTYGDFNSIGGPMGGIAGMGYGDPMGGFAGLGIGNPDSYGGSSGSSSGSSGSGSSGSGSSGSSGGGLAGSPGTGGGDF